ncbi:MAG: methyltransferase domain-containing protein [Pseudonocardiales bacterium]|nr:methyltransferase domain-containing protein [Pseudonocardiales bacterium]
MTTATSLVADTEWRAHAAALAAIVAEVADPRWAEAFAVVPRHVFVPRFFRRDAAGDLVAIEGSDPAQRAQWLEEVYSDTALTTQLGQIDPGNTLRPLTISASSSTKPTLMARMLTDLNAHPGHRVLEIGTGTGFNAALLCHRLHDGHVHSVDIHPELVTVAHARLVSLGYHPRLSCLDGAHGWAEHALYDRIIVTCGISTIPYPWVAQTRPGGLILTEALAGGHGMLARLTVADDGTACGHFLDYPGLFMTLRQTPHRIARPAELPPEQLHGARHASTTLDPAVLADPAFAFFCQLHLGSGRSNHHVVEGATKATVVAHDGSWAQTTSGTHGVLVTFDGTHNPWQTVETAHHTWTQLGRPRPCAFGLTVTPHQQHAWYQHPTSDWTHPLT